MKVFGKIIGTVLFAVAYVLLSVPDSMAQVATMKSGTEVKQLRGFAPQKLKAQTITKDKFIKRGKAAIAVRKLSKFDAKRNKYVDPFTKREYAPSDIIEIPESSSTITNSKGQQVTLKKPKIRMKASEYYTYLDEQEQYLNERGYSIKDKKRVGVIDEHRVNYQKFQQKKTEFERTIKSRVMPDFLKKPRTVMTRANLRQKIDLIKLRIKKDSPYTVPADYYPYNHTESYIKEFGDPDFMSVWYKCFLTAEMRTNLDDKFIRIRDEMSIGNTFFGNEITLVKVWGEAKMDNDNKADVKVMVTLQNDKWTKYDYSKNNYTGDWKDSTKEDRALFNDVVGDGRIWADTFFDQSWQFQAGPVPIVLTISVGGYINIRHEVNMTHSDVGEPNSYLLVEPYTGGYGTVIGAVGVRGFLEIGIGITLVVLEIGMPMRSGLTLKILKDADGKEITDPCQRNQIEANYHLGIRFTILKGYFFLHFMILGFGWDITVFEWDGYTFPEVVLLNVTESHTPCKRPPGLGLRGVSYDGESDKVTVIVGNQGGKIEQALRDRWRVAVRYNTNKTDCKFSGSDGDSLELLPISLLDPTDRLSQKIGNEVSYTFTNDLLGKRGLALNWNGYLNALVQVDGANANIQRCGATPFKRNRSIVVSDLQAKPSKIVNSPGTLSVVLKNPGPGPVFEGDLVSRRTYAWLKIKQLGSDRKTVLGETIVKNTDFSGQLNRGRQMKPGDAVSVDCSLSAERTKTLFPNCSKWKGDVCPGKMPFLVELYYQPEPSGAPPKSSKVVDVEILKSGTPKEGNLEATKSMSAKDAAKAKESTTKSTKASTTKSATKEKTSKPKIKR